MKPKPHKCKGCRSETNYCKVFPIHMDKNGIVKKCPCEECLVKGICIRSCEEYLEYIDSYYHEDVISIQKQMQIQIKEQKQWML